MKGRKVVPAHFGAWRRRTEKVPITEEQDETYLAITGGEPRKVLKQFNVGKNT